jgi:hypothetical protein
MTPPIHSLTVAAPRCATVTRSLTVAAQCPIGAAMRKHAGKSEQEKN